MILARTNARSRLCHESSRLIHTHTHTHTHTHKEHVMASKSGKIDRFVNVSKAKALLKGSGAVALLRPYWADQHNIRNGKNSNGTVLYSVNDIAEYVAMIVRERTNAALESDDVRLWRYVTDTANADGNTDAATWADGHLIDAIAASESSVITAEDITFD